jgi:hypothetical protein
MARLTEAEYSALAARAYQALKKFPNVTGVGLGSRYRGGVPTGEPALAVFVKRKVPRGSLSSGDLIPDQFEGYPTDVVEMPEFKSGALDDVPGLELDATNEDGARYRPVKGGIRCQSSEGAGEGTMGFLANVTGTNRVMAVTNYHVMFKTLPAPADSVRLGNPNTDQCCSDCCKGSFATSIAQDYNNVVDLAIAELDPQTQWLREIQCVGYLRGQHPVTQPEADSHRYRVRKYGSLTGLTGGVIVYRNVTKDIQSPILPTRHSTNAMVIVANRGFGGDQWYQFAGQGDSGSAVVNDANEVVGLVCGVSDPKNPAAVFTVAVPIEAILSYFQPSKGITLEVATATTLNDVQTTASASPDDHARELEARIMTERLKRDLAQSERGRAMKELWLRHSTELNRLVNTNKKAGAIWRRNHGPALFQHAISAARQRGRAIPSIIDERPVDELVDRLIDMFGRYGSDALKADIALGRGAFPRFAGRSYDDLLQMLRDQDPS